MFAIFLIASLITAEPIDWGDDYQTKTLKNISGLDVNTNLVIDIKAGFVMHRKGMERVFVLSENLKNCENQLTTRQDDPPLPPSFLDSYAGKLAIGGAGFLSGITTILLVLWVT